MKTNLKIFFRARKFSPISKKNRFSFLFLRRFLDILPKIPYNIREVCGVRSPEKRNPQLLYGSLRSGG